MEIAAKFITVTGLGIVELWAAIPVGTALNLHPILNGLASGLGSIIGALLVIIIGDRLRNWLLKKKEKTKKNKGRIYRIWEKYGVIGLGMLSPLLTGAPLGAAIGISLGASPKRLLFWMSIGIVVWTIPLTIISTLGFSFFGN
ncbi:MAG: small multi-drug export protein [Eubacteriales bacterium]|nr:small multi-drug export protein [Eubacteriales bacterium]MDD3198752.1 small multi-drug export protein [Eubacteriales bacterium]MDD4121465.1 small multi-drug export protein [Eubacteriales bacterium]MDD4629002.1 small multi-drug export protein [Eubacteriales bacterium]